ncbi:hypothetical protein T4D_15525 [Trichinella pseudospiralis]|uniref:Uncharacterized protein n=1 Tax=Trichinella pseudospiralis TaxID=6337 RepID=A0A0V1F3T6_TRIPS|nr:hypothetical protein T4D_15525 [Trichinella pseudospiralis]
MLTFNGMLSESDKVERLALCDHGDHGYDRHSGADPFRTHEGKFTQFAVRFRFLTIYHGDRALANEVAVRRVKRCVMVDALLPLLA